MKLLLQLLEAPVTEIVPSATCHYCATIDVAMMCLPAVNVIWVLRNIANATSEVKWQAELWLMYSNAI